MVSTVSTHSPEESSYVMKQMEASLRPQSRAASGGTRADPSSAKRDVIHAAARPQRHAVQEAPRHSQTHGQCPLEHNEQGPVAAHITLRESGRKAPCERLEA
ncbi:unnamed protein product [Boreogadus saida]